MGNSRGSSDARSGSEATAAPRGEGVSTRLNRTRISIRLCVATHTLLTFVCGEVRALCDEQTDALLALDVAVGFCAEAVDGEADEAEAVLVAHAEIDKGLGLLVGEKELQDCEVAKDAGAGHGVGDELCALVRGEAGIGGEELCDVEDGWVERVEVWLGRQVEGTHWAALDGRGRHSVPAPVAASKMQVESKQSLMVVTRYLTPSIVPNTSMPPLKRQKLDSRDDEELQSNASDDDSGGFSGSDSGSDEQIEGLKPQKSKQTKKRKIRAAAPSAFGATLQSLLNTDAPSTLPLSLKPSVTRKRNDEKLEMRAKKVLQVERKEKEDKGRITDVIGGWGGEGERALRKVAQRGGQCSCNGKQLLNVFQW